MRKNASIILMSLLLILSVSGVCSASVTTIKINDLIENSFTYDQTEVTIKAEVIGEALERGDYAWINLNDTSNALGAWVKKSDLAQIGAYGDYKHKGDIVKITGTFYRACSQHGGDVDIHCTNLEIVEKGYHLKEQLSWNKSILAGVLVIITGFVYLTYFKLKYKN